MLFERQRVLLTLLDALGGQSAPTDFQKLLFLYTREQSEPSYEFVPYRFGCFSFSSFVLVFNSSSSFLSVSISSLFLLVRL